MSLSIASYYENKRLIVTGGTGFVGSVLLQTIVHKLAPSCIAYCFYRSKPGLSAPGRLIWIQADLTRPDLGLSPAILTELRQNASIVFHLAANTSFKDTLLAQLEGNVLSSINILNLALSLASLECCLISSSGAASSFDPPPPPDAQLPELVLSPVLSPAEEAFLRGDRAPLLSLHASFNNRPVAYSYAKSLLERVFVTQYSSHPIILARIGLVVGAVSFPSPGYVAASLSGVGAAGIVQAVLAGNLTWPESAREIALPGVPIDLLVNAFIVNVAHRARVKSLVLINYGGDPRNPLRGKELLQPSNFESSSFDQLIEEFTSRNEMQRATALRRLRGYFAMSVVFANGNYLDATCRLSQEDAALFPVDGTKLDWKAVIKHMQEHLKKSKL